jgi:hypothetical protein
MAGRLGCQNELNHGLCTILDEAMIRSLMYHRVRFVLAALELDKAFECRFVPSFSVVA